MRFNSLNPVRAQDGSSFWITVQLPAGPRLKLLHQQRAEIDKRIEAVLNELSTAPAGEQGRERDVEVLRSLLGVGRVVAATILAEASQLLSERNYQALRSYAGIAPVYSSKRKKEAGYYALRLQGPIT